jgi:hypothetical protein
MPPVIDIARLVDWLGPEGARSGLRDSDIPLKELVELARARQLLLSPKPTREEVANELAYCGIHKIDKSLDEMMSMSSAALQEYLDRKRPTTTEVMGLLDRLGIKPGSEDRKHLRRFAAREVSELGMFQRVARGPAIAASRKS